MQCTLFTCKEEGGKAKHKTKPYLCSQILNQKVFLQLTIRILLRIYLQKLLLQ